MIKLALLWFYSSQNYDFCIYNQVLGNNEYNCDVRYYGGTLGSEIFKMVTKMGNKMAAKVIKLTLLCFYSRQDYDIGVQIYVLGGKDLNFDVRYYVGTLICEVSEMAAKIGNTMAAANDKIGVTFFL